MWSAVQILFGHFLAWQVHQTSPAGTCFRPHTTLWKLGHCDLLSPKYRSHEVCGTILFGHFRTWQVNQTSPAGTSYRPHTTLWKLGHCDLLSPKYRSHAVCGTNPVFPLPHMAGPSKKRWNTLLNKGDYGHNYEVLKSGKGTIIPKYRQGKDQNKNPGDSVTEQRKSSAITAITKHK